MRVALVAFMALCLLAVASAVTPKVVVKGAKLFVESTGDQFWVKGIAYQPSADPLSDYQGIMRDLPYFQQLGINAIRVYQATGATINHDAVMKVLEDAGIYVILDVSDPQNSINRDDPDWRVPLYNTLRAKIDAWIAYPNLLAFIAGNEVSNNIATSDASAFVKASLRDLKAYVKTLGYATPVGYATADVTEISVINEYFDCGSKEEQNDFWGVNIYRWCGDAQTFQTSGYSDVTEIYSSWDVPSILTEYGCNKNLPRTFPEILSIYGTDMKDVFSGGIAYEYHEEANGYGLVTLSGATVTPKADFTNFKNQLAKVAPTGVKMDAYTPSNTMKACPPVTASWRSSSTLPPVPSPTRCNCKATQLKCKLTVTDPSQVTTELAQKIAEAVGYVCGIDAASCNLISTNATSGTYGIWSMCDPLTAASIVLDNYVNTVQGSSCSFDGIAAVVTPTDTTTDCANQPLNYKDHGGSVHTPVADPATQTINTADRETGEYSTGQATTTGTVTTTGTPSTTGQSTTGTPATTGNPTDDNTSSALALAASSLVAVSAVLVTLA